jgi:predicted DNA-binding helix-hairpin-helix protein
MFSACANGLLAVLNQAGIHMKIAPATALTLGVRLSDMTDDESINIEIVEEPRSSDGLTFIDLVV